MALVAPIEVRAAWALAYIHSVVIRPVDGDGVVVPLGEDTDVFVVPPFTFCSERISEIICIFADQVVVRVILPLISWEEAEEI